MLDLSGKAHWFGMAFPRGGLWLWNLLSELSLFAGSWFISTACFRATEWFGVGHWSVRLTAPPAFSVRCKNLGEALLSWYEMADSKTPLLWIRSGQECQDCSKNAFFLSRVVAWSVYIDLIAQLPNTSNRPSRGSTQWSQLCPKAGLGGQPRTAQELNTRAAVSSVQPRTLSWLTNTVMLPRASCVTFQGKQHWSTYWFLLDDNIYLYLDFDNQETIFAN